MKYNLCVLFALAHFLGYSQLKPQIGGSLEYDYFNYFETIDDKINGRNEGTFTLSLSSDKKSNVKWNSDIEFRNDLLNENRKRVMLKEMFFSVPSGKFDISAGKRILNWGVTEGVSPLNCINPLDYSDILDIEDQEIGEYMIKTDFYHKDISIEVLYIPVTQYSILPTMDSRWFPELETKAPHPLDPTQTLPVEYQYVTKKQNTKTPEADFGAKCKYFFKGNDISLLYFNGYSNTPISTISNFGFTGEHYQATIEEFTYNLQILGLGFERFLGNVGLKIESAYHIPDVEDSIISDEASTEYIHSVISLERIFQGGEVIKNIHPIILYSNESPLDENNFDNKDLQHIFQNALVGKISIGIGDNTEVEVTGLYTFNASDFYMKSSCKYALADGAKCFVSGTTLGGETDGFFGSYDNNDRISLGFSYEF